jgi:SPP1 family predicted phage head-tail adaptor
MKAGYLDRRLLLERFIESQDADGQAIKTWSPVSVVWASISPIRGNELLKADQPIGALDTRINIRYSETVSSVDNTWRARHGAVVYDIVSVAHKFLKQVEIELMCKSGLHADATNEWLTSEDGEFLMSEDGEYLVA